MTRDHRAKLDVRADIGGTKVEFFYACATARDEVEHYLIRSARNATTNLRSLTEAIGPTEVSVECVPTVYIPSLATEHVDWARGVVDRVQQLADEEIVQRFGTGTTAARWGAVVYDDRVISRPRSWLQRLTDRILRVDDALEQIRDNPEKSSL